MPIKNIILGTFLVDSYSLGAHWIYDEKQLADLDWDWEKLNPPAAMWHKGKDAGDFTHYGDHMLWLLEYVTQEKKFDVEAYAKFWEAKMDTYDGYIDGSSRETLQHLKEGRSALEGVVNHDLSICGRISPLLLVSNDLKSFVTHAISFARLTHNDPLVLEAVDFFATLLYHVMDGQEIEATMRRLSPNYSNKIVTWIDAGIQSKDQDTFTAIRNFGPACGVEGGFAGTIHLLSKYSSVEAMMVENAKAGGDSSARGMTAGMILAARENKTYPLTSQIDAYSTIQKLLQG